MSFLKRYRSNDVTEPYGKMQQDFYFIIEDIFGPLDSGGIIVVGKPCNSPVYKDRKVEILSAERRIPTKIIGLETYRKLQEAVDKDTNVGMLLEGMTKLDVRPGSLIVLPGEGCVDYTIGGLVAVLKSKDGEKAKIQGGQSIRLKFFKQIYRAKITYQRVERESEDGELVRFVAVSEEQIPYVNKEIVKLLDDNGETFAIGRVYEMNT